MTATRTPAQVIALMATLIDTSVPDSHDAGSWSVLCGTSQCTRCVEAGQVWIRDHDQAVRVWRALEATPGTNIAGAMLPGGDKISFAAQLKYHEGLDIYLSGRTGAIAVSVSRGDWAKMLESIR